MFLEKDLSYKLMGIFFEIRNKYGSGHHERVYDRVMSEIFNLRGINHVSQPRINIYSVDTGKLITYYQPDKLVENKIIIEIKARPFTSLDNERQTAEYLKNTKYEIIYLVNFGEGNFKPRRYIHTSDRKDFLKTEK